MKKNHIYRKVINQNAYFEKKYSDYGRLKKVVAIHSVLEKNGFQNVLPIVYHDSNRIRQNWCEPSRVANYKNKQDRLDLIQVIQRLHQTNEKIDWGKIEDIPPYTLRKKWGTRIQKFERMKNVLAPLFPTQYDQCLSLAKSIYFQMEDFKKPSQLTLNHGDLAHHNFLHYNNKWHIIDFDLAYIGYAEHELISWVQRLLPFVGYNLLQLIEEMPELASIAPYWEWIAFPNEEMREMLYYCHLESKEKENFIPFLMKFLDEASIKRYFLQKQIQSIL